VKANTMWTSSICDMVVREALGLSYAIKWVQELQLTIVDFELDAKRVIDYFNSGSNDISEFGDISLMFVRGGAIRCSKTLSLVGDRRMKPLIPSHERSHS